jgi:hypothetical protein
MLLSAALTVLSGKLRELACVEFVCAAVAAPVHDPPQGLEAWGKRAS